MMPAVDLRQRYLDLLKRTLTFSLWPEPPTIVDPRAYKSAWKRALVAAANKTLNLAHFHLAKTTEVSDEEREEGRVWPGYADTMIGLKRLNNLQSCVETVIADGVPGDLIETGVWRGGSCIFMRAILAAHQDSVRKVYVADSFEGLPKPDSINFPADAGDLHHAIDVMVVSLETVKQNFRRFGFDPDSDPQIVFLKGWFKDTIPQAPIQKLAVLRLDGDMYQSTIEVLNALYDKLSSGGFCIIDDFSLEGCRRAVEGFRRERGIEVPLIEVDYTGRYWRKP